ncbi:tripartite tricarboxylate transporter permease [Salmonella enterica subsp. enterica]|nr:tripartite tricarboxylate transporter permease [Salmonella enterica subsp. enterica]
MFTEQPDIVWGLIAALLIANVMLLIAEYPVDRSAVHPYAHHSAVVLVPAIAAVSAVGNMRYTAPPSITSADGRARRVRVHFT